jgi:hypothetical protein
MTREAALEAALIAAKAILDRIAVSGAKVGPLYSHALATSHRIANALSTPPDPPAVSVPAGWKLVQIEPDLQQVGAMAKALCPPARPWDRQPEGVRIVNLGLAKLCWEAGLAAAPPPPVRTGRAPSREEIADIVAAYLTHNGPITDIGADLTDALCALITEGR